MLIDENYTFDQILTDSTLIFQESPENYKFEKQEYCWFRISIKNNSVYTQKGYLQPVPEMNNILYYYNFETKKWNFHKAGISIVDYKRVHGVFPIVLQPKQINTFYFKIKVAELHSQKYPVKLYVNAYSETVYENEEQLILVSSLVVCFAMLLFVIYNLYIFIVLKDITYLYYSIMIIGAILYIIHFSRVSNFILPFSFYGIEVQPNGLLYFYTLDSVLSTFFIWLLVFGYMEFARNYLQLSIYFKFWNRIFKRIFITFSLFFLVFFIVCFFKSFYLYLWFSSISNIFVGIIMLLIVYVSILSYRKGYKLGRYFLIANFFPLLFIFVIAIYFLIYKYNTQPIQLVPHIALVSQTLAFAIALVARINLLKDELKEKQFEAQTLQNQNEEMLARNRYIELENEQIMSEMVMAVNNETDLRNKMHEDENRNAELEQEIQLELQQKQELQQKLEANQRELTANSLYLYQKNELLTNLQKQIQQLSYKDTTTQNREGIREIKSAIKNDIQLDNDWDNFKIHFEEVHPNFFTDLMEKYPTLTQNEVQLSAYYHLNMTAKEIATLLNINPTSVHRAKSRLNKKIEKLENEDS